MIKAQRAKIKQYKEIIAAIRKAGFKVVLHTLIMGVRGWMPEHTWNELGRLGIPRVRRKKLYESLSRLAVQALVSSINLRRKLETRGDWQNTNKYKSGYVEFRETIANARREAKAKQKSDKARMRSRIRPKKGEG